MYSHRQINLLLCFRIACYCCVCSRICNPPRVKTEIIVLNYCGPTVCNIFIAICTALSLQTPHRSTSTANQNMKDFIEVAQVPRPFRTQIPCIESCAEEFRMMGSRVFMYWRRFLKWRVDSNLRTLCFTVCVCVCLSFASLSLSPCQSLTTTNRNSRSYSMCFFTLTRTQLPTP